jgi:ligand-binding SRPBCC domain-containing protein
MSGSLRGSQVPRIHTLERAQVVPVEAETAFAFFGDAWNLEAITPPWLRFRIEDAPAELRRGARLRYRLSLFGVPVRWLTEIVEWKPPRTFVDLQLEGPYRLWEHTHRIRPVAGGTEIYDHVRYALPLDPLASLARPLTVERWLDAIFDFRARRVAELVR